MKFIVLLSCLYFCLAANLKNNNYPTTTPFPTTARHTTHYPYTTTNYPTTARPTTHYPYTTPRVTTARPTTNYSTTARPTTNYPTTARPTTNYPTTARPTTNYPTTARPTTNYPTTARPTTNYPTTARPTTNYPTTARPTTNYPTTARPTTNYPTTARPTTNYPTTARPTTSTTWSTSSCPDGWIDGGQLGCFYFHYQETKLNWVEAQAACEMLGGYLAEIKSEEQNNFVESMAIIEENFSGVQSWWLGLSDIGHEGRWMWGHSVDDADFTSWGPGHPNTFPGNQDDCVAITLEEHFHWKDLSCSQTHHKSPSPICQRDVEGITTPQPFSTTTTPQETTTSYSTHVELRGGNVPSEGNVFVVNSQNRLGPVCDDDWGNVDARVVCRQLGYADGSATTGSLFGSVSSTFAMDDVSCAGPEEHIQDCRYETSDNCSGSEGAGVRCSAAQTTTRGYIVY